MLGLDVGDEEMLKKPLVIVILLLVVGGGGYLVWGEDDIENARINNYRMNSELPELEADIRENTDRIRELEYQLAQLSENTDNLWLKTADWHKKWDEDVRYLRGKMDRMQELLMEMAMRENNRTNRLPQ